MQKDKESTRQTTSVLSGSKSVVKFVKSGVAHSQPAPVRAGPFEPFTPRQTTCYSF
jgi:hypothetical protein